METVRFAKLALIILGMTMYFLNYCLIPIILRFMGKDSAPLYIPDLWTISYFSVIGITSMASSLEGKLNKKSWYYSVPVNELLEKKTPKE